MINKSGAVVILLLWEGKCKCPERKQSLAVPQTHLHLAVWMSSLHRNKSVCWSLELLRAGGCLALGPAGLHVNSSVIIDFISIRWLSALFHLFLLALLMHLKVQQALHILWGRKKKGFTEADKFTVTKQINISSNFTATNKSTDPDPLLLEGPHLFSSPWHRLLRRETDGNGTFWNIKFSKLAATIRPVCVRESVCFTCIICKWLETLPWLRTEKSKEMKTTSLVCFGLQVTDTSFSHFCIKGCLNFSQIPDWPVWQPLRKIIL